MRLIWLLFLILNPGVDGWDLLSSVELKREYNDFMGQEVDVPVFSPYLLAQNGSSITLDGYVIPLQQSSEQEYFVLSRFPFQSCFFCGNAGPETVAEVYTNRAFSATDQRVRVTGMLELNQDDPLHLFYIIKNAEVKSL